MLWSFSDHFAVLSGPSPLTVIVPSARKLIRTSLGATVMFHPGVVAVGDCGAGTDAWSNFQVPTTLSLSPLPQPTRARTIAMQHQAFMPQYRRLPAVQVPLWHAPPFA